MASPPGSTTAMRSAYAGYLCDTTKYTRVAFPGPNGPTQWQLLVATPTVAAWKAFAQVMTDHQYLFRESAGGTYNCRQIAGSSSYSLHAYALAIDLNPSKNPHRTSTTDMPKAFRDAIAAIATKSGRLVFMWGGTWSGSSQDTMHYQIGATPSEIATGITYPTKEPDDMPLNDNDLKQIRGVVSDELDKRLKMETDQTNRFSKAVWQHVGTGDTGTATMLRAVYNWVSKQK